MKVFLEDVAVLEAQQRMIDLNPNASAISIKVDAAPLAARRALQRLIATELAPRPIDVPG